MEMRISLEGLKAKFDQNLEEILEQFHNQLVSQYQTVNIERLYYFIKFSLPRELGEWLKREMGQYNVEITNCVFKTIEQEERSQECYGCKYHQEMTQRIKNRISNPPQVIQPEIGVNNVLYQGFGAFWLRGGVVYLGLSFIPLVGFWFRLLQMAISSGVGVYYGVKTYKKFDQLYRKELLGIAEDFLAENKKRFQEWFDQIIYFSEEEREICRQ